MDWNENKTYHEEHRKNFGTTIGYNKTIIWIYIIYIVVALILSAIFVYLPISRIEDRVDLLSAFLVDETEQAKLKFDKVVAFVDKIEPEVDLVIRGVKQAIKEACESGIIRDVQICTEFGAPLPIGSLQPTVGDSTSGSNTGLFNTRVFESIPSSLRIPFV